MLLSGSFRENKKIDSRGQMKVMMAASDPRCRKLKEFKKLEKGKLGDNGRDIIRIFQFFEHNRFAAH